MVTSWHGGRRLTAVVQTPIVAAVGDRIYLGFPDRPDAVFAHDADADAAIAEASAAETASRPA